MQEKRFIYETEEYKYYLVPEDEGAEGAFFVNHEKANDRGGHFGHAMVECPNGDIIAWYPNCNADNGGHSGRGWMEYKRSSDKGITWTEGKPFPYSKTLWDLNLGMSVINEKAIVADDGTIILFNLICDVATDALWEPYFAPTYILSRDNGETWETAKRFTSLHGRVFDVYKRNGMIYVLFEAGFSSDPKKLGFRLYCSLDNGKTFFLRSSIPFDLRGRYYGNLEELEDGSLIAYTYNEDNEYYIEYSTSSDDGKSWSEVKTTYFPNRIRNPQIIKFKDTYFAFGRSGGYGEDFGHIAMYCSPDGLNWNDGLIIARRRAGVCAYSNPILIGGGEKILYQSSHSYRLNLTNVRHWFIEAEKK